MFAQGGAVTNRHDRVFRRWLTDGGFLTIGDCSKRKGFCFPYYFMEIFVGGQGLDGGRQSHDGGILQSPPQYGNLEKSRNLKETSESHGIYLKRQGICERIPKVREFCCLKFIFSQVEDPNFENFLRSMPPDPLNGARLTVERNLGLEKSGNFILSGKWQP